MNSFRTSLQDFDIFENDWQHKQASELKFYTNTKYQISFAQPLIVIFTHLTRNTLLA